MVFIHPPDPHSLITGYLMADLAESEIDKVNADFELGSGAKYSANLELMIKQIDAYREMSHADIRRAETTAGRPEPFLLIDRSAIDEDAVWYVEDFARDDQVENGDCVSEDVLLEILVRTTLVTEQHACWTIGHGADVQECLVQYGGVEYPVPVDFEQVNVYDYGKALDWDSRRQRDRISVTLEPGEYEVTTAPEDLELYRSTMQVDRLVRLTERVAAETGLSAEWTSIIRPATAQETEEGELVTFPEGSLTIEVDFTTGDKRPLYRRPEGSFAGFPARDTEAQSSL